MTFRKAPAENMMHPNYREMLKAQASLDEDVCVCDLYVDSPPDIRVRYDSPGGS